MRDIDLFQLALGLVTPRGQDYISLFVDIVGSRHQPWRLVGSQIDRLRCALEAPREVGKKSKIHGGVAQPTPIARTSSQSRVREWLA